MKFIKFKNDDIASLHVANEMIDLIKSNPKAILGLATGSTPIKLYNCLAQDYKENKTDWSNITTFNLDEYLGLPENHPQTYKVFMDQHLFSKTNIKKENTNFPEMNVNYDELISKDGGIDLQILGIGTNGHIGFNEPGSPLDSLTRIVDLTPETIKVNAQKFFNGDEKDVPKKALSMGIKSILGAKKIILLAFGPSKNEAMRKLKELKTFDINFPASALVLHNDVTIIVDEDAAKDLDL
ncbi:MAG: glucosamine-6-phosphate deaminase [Mycoplasma sp.]|nr:glucosamine-6-phosphate deaminase [Mycoplasma sp.]